MQGPCALVEVTCPQELHVAFSVQWERSLESQMGVRRECEHWSLVRMLRVELIEAPVPVSAGREVGPCVVSWAWSLETCALRALSLRLGVDEGPAEMLRRTQCRESARQSLRAQQWSEAGAGSSSSLDDSSWSVALRKHRSL